MRIDCRPIGGEPGGQGFCPLRGKGHALACRGEDALGTFFVAGVVLLEPVHNLVTVERCLDVRIVQQQP